MPLWRGTLVYRRCSTRVRQEVWTQSQDFQNKVTDQSADFQKKYLKGYSRIFEALQQLQEPKRGRRREELGQWGLRRISWLIKEKWSQDSRGTGEFHLEDTVTACILEKSLSTRQSRGHFRPSELPALETPTSPDTWAASSRDHLALLLFWGEVYVAGGWGVLISINAQQDIDTTQHTLRIQNVENIKTADLDLKSTATNSQNKSILEGSPLRSWTRRERPPSPLYLTMFLRH